MDKYEELKLLFSKIDEYFDDAKDDYEERYRAWLKIIFNNESDRAKSEMPKVGVLKQLVIDWLNEHNKILPLSRNIRVRSGLINAKKATRHSNKGDALSKTDWEHLIEMLQKPKHILYDNKSGKILYLSDSADRLNQLCIEFDYRKANYDCMIVSAYKVNFKNIQERIKSGNCSVIK